MDIGLIVDVETTGLDPDSDKIIEIGILQFGMGEEGTPVVCEVYGALEDPGETLPDEIVKLTGITQEQVQGRRIDWRRVRSYFESASVVIAHNARFDKAFLDRRPEMKEIRAHWACSAMHIDWPGHGAGSRKLNYIAADHGFVNPFAHRAVFDCATTFQVVRPYISELIQRSYEREFKVLARHSPFETKDTLREHGYRWDPNERVWGKLVPECEIDTEKSFLQQAVYVGMPNGAEVVEVETLNH